MSKTNNTGIRTITLSDLLDQSDYNEMSDSELQRFVHRYYESGAGDLGLEEFKPKQNVQSNYDQIEQDIADLNTGRIRVMSAYQNWENFFGNTKLYYKPERHRWEPKVYKDYPIGDGSTITAHDFERLEGGKAVGVKTNPNDKKSLSYGVDPVTITYASQDGKLWWSDKYLGRWVEITEDKVGKEGLRVLLESFEGGKNGEAKQYSIPGYYDIIPNTYFHFNKQISDKTEGPYEIKLGQALLNTNDQYSKAFLLNLIKFGWLNKASHIDIETGTVTFDNQVDALSALKLIFRTDYARAQGSTQPKFYDGPSHSLSMYVHGQTTATNQDDVFIESSWLWANLNRLQGASGNNTNNPYSEILGEKFESPQRVASAVWIPIVKIDGNVQFLVDESLFTKDGITKTANHFTLPPGAEAPTKKEILDFMARQNGKWIDVPKDQYQTPLTKEFQRKFTFDEEEYAMQIEAGPEMFRSVQGDDGQWVPMLAVESFFQPINNKKYYEYNDLSGRMGFWNGPQKLNYDEAYLLSQVLNQANINLGIETSMRRRDDIRPEYDGAGNRLDTYSILRVDQFFDETKSQLQQIVQKMNDEDRVDTPFAKDLSKAQILTLIEAIENSERGELEGIHKWITKNVEDVIRDGMSNTLFVVGITVAGILSTVLYRNIDWFRKLEDYRAAGQAKAAQQGSSADSKVSTKTPGVQIMRQQYYEDGITSHTMLGRTQETRDIFSYYKRLIANENKPNKYGLLHAPGGSGKTFLAKQIAKALHLGIYSDGTPIEPEFRELFGDVMILNIGELVQQGENSGVINEAGKRIREAVNIAKDYKERTGKYMLIFVDEFHDSLFVHGELTDDPKTGRTIRPFADTIFKELEGQPVLFGIATNDLHEKFRRDDPQLARRYTIIPVRKSETGKPTQANFDHGMDELQPYYVSRMLEGDIQRFIDNDDFPNLDLKNIDQAVLKKVVQLAAKRSPIGDPDRSSITLDSYLNYLQIEAEKQGKTIKPNVNNIDRWHRQNPPSKSDLNHPNVKNRSPITDVMFDHPPFPMKGTPQSPDIQPPEVIDLEEGSKGIWSRVRRGAKDFAGKAKDKIGIGKDASDSQSTPTPAAHPEPAPHPIPANTAKPVQPSSPPAPETHSLNKKWTHIISAIDGSIPNLPSAADIDEYLTDIAKVDSDLSDSDLIQSMSADDFFTKEQQDALSKLLPRTQAAESIPDNSGRDVLIKNLGYLTQIAQQSDISFASESSEKIRQYLHYRMGDSVNFLEIIRTMAVDDYFNDNEKQLLKKVLEVQVISHAAGSGDKPDYNAIKEAFLALSEDAEVFTDEERLNFKKQSALMDISGLNLVEHIDASNQQDFALKMLGLYSWAEHASLEDIKLVSAFAKANPNKFIAEVLPNLEPSKPLSDKVRKLVTGKNIETTETRRAKYKQEYNDFLAKEYGYKGDGSPESLVAHFESKATVQSHPRAYILYKELSIFNQVAKEDSVVRAFSAPSTYRSKRYFTIGKTEWLKTRLLDRFRKHRSLEHYDTSDQLDIRYIVNWAGNHADHAARTLLDEKVTKGLHLPGLYYDLYFSSAEPNLPTILEFDDFLKSNPDLSAYDTPDLIQKMYQSDAFSTDQKRSLKNVYAKYYNAHAQHKIQQLTHLSVLEPVEVNQLTNWAAHQPEGHVDLIIQYANLNFEGFRKSVLPHLKDDAKLGDKAIATLRSQIKKLSGGSAGFMGTQALDADFWKALITGTTPSQRALDAVTSDITSTVIDLHENTDGTFSLQGKNQSGFDFSAQLSNLKTTGISLGANVAGGVTAAVAADMALRSAAGAADLDISELEYGVSGFIVGNEAGYQTNRLLHSAGVVAGETLDRIDSTRDNVLAMPVSLATEQATSYAMTRIGYEQGTWQNTVARFGAGIGAEIAFDQAVLNRPAVKAFAEKLIPPRYVAATGPLVELYYLTLGVRLVSSAKENQMQKLRKAEQAQYVDTWLSTGINKHLKDNVSGAITWNYHDLASELVNLGVDEFDTWVNADGKTIKRDLDKSTSHLILTEVAKINKAIASAYSKERSGQINQQEFETRLTQATGTLWNLIEQHKGNPKAQGALLALTAATWGEDILPYRYKGALSKVSQNSSAEIQIASQLLGILTASTPLGKEVQQAKQQVAKGLKQKQWYDNQYKDNPTSADWVARIDAQMPKYSNATNSVVIQSFVKKQIEVILETEAEIKAKRSYADFNAYADVGTANTTPIDPHKEQRLTLLKEKRDEAATLVASLSKSLTDDNLKALQPQIVADMKALQRLTAEISKIPSMSKSQIESQNLIAKR